MDGIGSFHARKLRAAAGLQQRIGKQLTWGLEIETAKDTAPVMIREDPQIGQCKN